MVQHPVHLCTIFNFSEIFGGRTIMRDQNDFERESRGQYNDYYKDDRYGEVVFVLFLGEIQKLIFPYS